MIYLVNSTKKRGIFHPIEVDRGLDCEEIRVGFIRLNGGYELILKNSLTLVISFNRIPLALEAIGFGRCLMRRPLTSRT